MPEADCFRAEGVLTVFAGAAADSADFTGEGEVTPGFAVFRVALAARWAFVVFFVDIVILLWGLQTTLSRFSGAHGAGRPPPGKTTILPRQMFPSTV